MQMRNRHLIGLSVVAMTLQTGACLAAPQQLAWPTFFRAAPSHDGLELQELDRGTTVDVLGCQGGQCQVRYGGVVGYVDQAMLGPPNMLPAGLMPAGVPAAAPNPAPSCVQARQAGYESGLTYDFCQR